MRSQSSRSIARRYRGTPTIARAAGLVLALTSLAASRAEAIPAFAHAYGMTCQKCHSVIPRLSDFGEAFRVSGFALPGTRPQHALPLSVKINTAYSSEPDPSGLPKATLDEVELFVAGRIGARANYFIEQYAVDGGRPGATRDAWIGYRATPDDARVPVRVQVGSFTLPLPVDPESFRESLAHYAIFDQRVGRNPFAFFDAKLGGGVRIGNEDRGTSVGLFALGGHDPQSGIAAHGVDTMTVLSHALGPLTLSAYRYAGARPVDGGLDRFWRAGYGATVRTRELEFDAVIQTGNDDRPGDGAGPARSSGGLAQVRYTFDRRTFASLRYEGTNDQATGFMRQLVPLVGYRVTRNSRFTIEDVITHVPVAKHALGMQYTVAY